jgi:hypothetical protein
MRKEASEWRKRGGEETDLGLVCRITRENTGERRERERELRPLLL